MKMSNLTTRTFIDVCHCVTVRAGIGGLHDVIVRVPEAARAVAAGEVHELVELIMTEAALSVTILAPIAAQSYNQTQQ